MTLNRFSKTTLLLGSAALLMACSADDNGKTITDTAQVVKTQTVEKSSYKMIEYKTAGQTDADHLYLEEVLGEKALDEVKAWNRRSLDELKVDSRYEKFYQDALTILQSKDKAMERCIISGRMKPMCAAFGANQHWTHISLMQSNGRPFSILIS